MVVEMHLTLLTTLLISLAGVQCLRPKLVYVKPGEMVALHCPHNNAKSQLIWTIPTSQEMNLTDSKSALAYQSQMGVLIDGRSLIILRVSASHEGNYSCSHSKASSHFWFTLIVYSVQSKENKERGQYPTTCYTQESCMLYCPEVNIPWVRNSNITSHSITWDKKGNTSPTQNYFLTVEEKDSGVYTCTRSYLYDGQIYNMTFTVVLDVKLSKETGQSVILAPKQNDVFPVDLGSTVVIECKAVLYSNADMVFWLSGSTFVETDDSLPVFCNESREENADEIKMTMFLVFREVSEEDLSKNFTCKLQSDHQLSSFITITLTQKAVRSVSLLVSICIAGIMVLLIIIVATGCAKFKVDIALFLRDTFGCYVNSSDVKSYDAYLLSYNSAKGLSEGDRRWLESVLEERFGYSLCLYNHNALPEKAGAEAVISCTEQSRSVVLVPSLSNSNPGSDLLNNILAALVERQTRLVFIIPETIQVSNRNLKAESLKHLCENKDCVIWKGRNSKEPNSSFLKLLRYHLLAPQHATRVLRQTKHPDVNLFNI